MATTLPKPVQIRSRVRIRTGSPSTASPLAGRIEPGAILQPIGEIAGEAVAGNASWYEIETGKFIWSGACGPVPGGVPPTSAAPSSGQLSVLSVAQIQAEFGTFTYSETT